MTSVSLLGTRGRAGPSTSLKGQRQNIPLDEASTHCRALWGFGNLRFGSSRVPWQCSDGFLAPPPRPLSEHLPMDFGSSTPDYWRSFLCSPVDERCQQHLGRPEDGAAGSERGVATGATRLPGTHPAVRKSQSIMGGREERAKEPRCSGKTGNTTEMLLFAGTEPY